MSRCVDNSDEELSTVTSCLHDLIAQHVHMLVVQHVQLLDQ